MSRLLSALLVLAMLCAMVPAAFAATTTSNHWTQLKEKSASGESINELWRGDTFELPVAAGCTGKRVTTFYKSDGVTKLNNNSNYSSSNNTNNCTYVSYTSSTTNTNVGTYSASRTTLTTDNTLPNGYIIAKVTCSDTTCTHANAKEYKLKIYEPATAFSVKQTSVVLTEANTKDNPLCIDVTLSPAAVRNEIEWTNESDDSAAKASYNPATKQIELVYNKEGSNDLLFTVDAGTNHPKQVTITVTTSASAVVNIKKGISVVATTKEPGEETVSVGDKMTLTATVDGATGTTNKVTWTSSDSTKVYVSYEGGAVTARAVGKAVITATSVDTGAKADYAINVIDAIKSVTLKENNANGNEVTSKEVTVSKTPFTIAAVTDPTGSESSVKWSVSDENVLNINVSGNNYDTKTKTATGATVKVTPVKAGKATLTATIGGKSKSMTVTVWAAAKTIVDYSKRSDYTIRDGSDLVTRFQKKYPTIYAELEDESDVEVSVTWTYFKYNYNTKNEKTGVTLYGYLDEADTSEYAKYKFAIGGTDGNNQVIATAALTNEGEVTQNIITASKTSAVAGDKITFTAKATAEPSDAKLAYQWYKNGTRISGATSASYTFTVPEASEDSTTTYKFTCGVTATRNGTTSAVLESNTVTLNVSRDYSIELTVDDSKAAYTVGETPKVTATVYKWNGSSKTTVGNVSGMSWELLDASTSKSLSNNIATISGSGTSASVTTKATGNASGQKITVQATVSINGYTYTGKKDITLSAATASFTMSGGSGSSIKATTIQSKAKAAVGNSSNVGFSYVKFDTPRNCTLTKSSSSSTAIGSTACYFSTTSGQKLSDVYVKLSGNATSGSVVYTVYDTNDNAVVTGTITFDSTAGEGSITCLGVEFDDADVVEMIEEEFANASGDVEYVKFDALASKYGRLLVGYKGIVEIDKAKDVKDTDKFYLKNSSSVDGVEDLYLLPRTDYYGTIEIGYTAYSSSNKSLGEGKLTFTVVRKTSSSKFTDVTASNVGSWAADAIDFMAGNGLVGGTGNNKFSPTGTMTRGDLVLIMYRMAGEPSVTGVENPFTDVKTADYYYKAILWAYKNGVVNGTGNGTTFSPKSNITREQIAAILYRYSGTTTATGSIASFTDAAKVSDYAVTALKWAVGAGIIGGSNNKLNPQGNATRAEVAVMLHRFLNK